MQWYLLVLRKYADFNGRARRKEFWMFALFNMIFGILAALLDGLIGTDFGEMGSGVISLIYSLAILIPSIAVAVRRLHDIGKSGAWIFIGFIPLIGAIWLLVLTVMEGDAATNQYGPDPKNPNQEIADALV